MSEDKKQSPTDGAHFALISPLFVPQHGGGTVKPCAAPLSTIATTGSIGVVTPFLKELENKNESEDSE